MLALWNSKSPDVVRALLEGKAELEAKDEVRDFANACSKAQTLMRNPNPRPHLKPQSQPSPLFETANSIS